METIDDLSSAYHDMFDNASDAMLLIKDEKFISCNAAALSMLKARSRSQLHQICPTLLSPERQAGGISSKEKAKQMFQRVAEKGSHKFEWVHRDFEGVEFPVEVSLTHINLRGENLIHVVLRDLDEQYHRLSHVEIGELVYQNTNDAIMIADSKNQIIDVNPAFELITGYSRSEAVGRKTGFMKSGVHGKNFYKNMWAELHEKDVWSGEIWDMTKSGKVYPKQVKIHAIKGFANQVVNYVAIFSDSSDKVKHQQELERLAFYDALTGLPNRSLLLKKLNYMVESPFSGNDSFHIAFVDIDKFKIINDTKGHTFGDAILTKVSEALADSLKNSGICGRMSGDEFLIIFNRNVSRDEVEAIVHNVLSRFEQPLAIENIEYYVSLSVGLNQFDVSIHDVKELIAGADVAMYQAKQRVGNNCAWYNTTIGKEFNETHELELDLIKAIKAKEFYPNFQPIIELSTGKVVGCESLARWLRNQTEQVSPAKFIPVAEKLSRFNELSTTLLQKSCRFMTKSLATKGMLLSVNVAANEIADEDFFFSFIETIKLSGFALNQVQVEITETSLIENFECAKLNIEKLKRSGIRIALDDFGAGFSSLTYLNKLALNTIKLDKSLTHNLDNEKNRIIVRSIIDMAHKLDITVVAEGVEEVEQVTCLKDLACDLVQGFYYAKPMSETDFSELPGYLVN